MSVPFQRGENWQPTEQWSHANRGTGLTRCGRCSQVWWQSGNYTSHCGQCCRTFTSLMAFDTHHEIVDGRLVCHDPETMLDGEGRLRFVFIDGGYHLGETSPGYWAHVPVDERVAPVGTPELPSSVSTAPMGNQGQFPIDDSMDGAA